MIPILNIETIQSLECKINQSSFIFFVYIAGDIQVSTYPGRIIVTENPKGFVQPRINVDKHSMRHVLLNGQTMLPCIAQGHPVPTYR